MTDKFNWNHQWCEPPHGTHEVLQVRHETLLPNGLELVVQEDDDGAACRHIDVARRSCESGYQTKQIGKYDEDRKSTNNAQIFVAVVTDITFELLIQKFNKE